ncbi:MAG TPA: nicotinate-nucleotide adenylyltransferase [Rhodanobacteraceae bacterium]|nr:nicotinate-nucleotide adenylyltransferase [Rhodanobacteraceae bacterium]
MSAAAQPPRPLAILGGTFDPVHLGHLRAAWEAAAQLGAEVRLLPARTPPHRPQPVASPAQRVALLRASLAGQGRLTLDLSELQRDGPSYMVDTLAGLRREIGAERPLVLLVGNDAFAGLATWHRWRELFAHAHLGVLTRPGENAAWPQVLADECSARRRDDLGSLRSVPSGCVFELHITALDISASAIRALLARGELPHYLMAEAALEPALLEPYLAGTGDQGPGTG